MTTIPPDSDPAAPAVNAATSGDAAKSGDSAAAGDPATAGREERKATQPGGSASSEPAEGEREERAAGLSGEGSASREAATSGDGAAAHEATPSEAAPSEATPSAAAPAAPAEAASAAEGTPPVDEVEELRVRVRNLEAQQARPRKRRWRVFSSGLLIVLSCLLAMLSVVAVWANDQITDTDRYVATVAPLATNPDVQNAITNRVTTVVLDQIDVNAVVNQLKTTLSQRGVPSQATDLVNGLSGPITSGLTTAVSSVVHGVVTSSAFATVWSNANRAIHQTMVKALTGQGGGAVSLANNQVTIDLAPIIAQVKTRLVDSGLAIASHIPAVHTSFVVFQSQQLGKIKTYVQLLEIAGNWLPVVAVLIGAWGIYLARDRRKALFRTAVGYALAMLALGLGLTAFRQIYLNQLPPGVNQGAARAVYDALVNFLRQSVRAIGALAVVTAIGAYVIGPSRSAVAIRTACRTGIGAVRSTCESIGFRTGPVGPFVHTYKHWIGAVILAGAAIALFFWNHATVSVVLWLAVIVLAAFAIREFLDAPRSRRTKEVLR